MVDLPTAERHGVCPVCEGYGGGEAPEGHENADCQGSCPKCWCPGCHDGNEMTSGWDPCGSWEAYQAVQKLEARQS